MTLVRWQPTGNKWVLLFFFQLLVIVAYITESVLRFEMKEREGGAREAHSNQAPN